MDITVFSQSESVNLILIPLQGHDKRNIYSGIAQNTIQRFEHFEDPDNRKSSVKYTWKTFICMKCV